ncbi:MAG: L-threonylcarbamoyladenylate synthase [Polyangiaceae bacterium]
MTTTRTLLVDPHSPDPGVIREAVAILERGGLVAFPTETVYGLGARALDEAAIERIFKAKGRPARHPIIAHVEGVAGAQALSAEWSERASRLARAFWPGPLTLVVPRASSVPSSLSGGTDSIAIRAPAHPVARALLEMLGEPLAAPSANRYQSLSPTLAEHVLKSLDGEFELLLDAGPCARGIESTVVDVRAERSLLLRPGALDLAQIRAIDASIEVANGLAAEGEERASPGMDARHYAPRAKLVVASDAGAVDVARTHREAGARVGLVLRGEGPALQGVTVRTLSLDPLTYEAALFATLHALDDAGCDVIVVAQPPAEERWLAVRDRLDRARVREG